MADPIQDWRELLPEELRSEPMFKDVPSVATLGKIAKDLKEYQGRSVALPAADATPEQKAEFFAKLTEKVPDLGSYKAKAEEFEKVQASTKAREAAEKEADQALRKEWGYAYDDKAAAARAAAKAMGVPEGAVTTMPPVFLKVFAEAAARLTGNVHQAGTQGPGLSTKRTPAEAARRIKEIQSNPAYWKGDQALVQEMLDAQRDAMAS